MLQIIHFENTESISILNAIFKSLHFCENVDLLLLVAHRLFIRTINMKIKSFPCLQSLKYIECLHSFQKYFVQFNL